MVFHSPSNTSPPFIHGGPIPPSFFALMEDFVWSSWRKECYENGFSNWDHTFLAPNASNHDGCGGGSGGDDGGNGGGGWEEGKNGSASKNHSEAEKRRRDRINAHLATLRKLVSNSDKMDKATLLGKVVERVKELKTESLELSKVFTVPTDLDEVIIDLDSSSTDDNNNNNNNNNVFIKTSICCEDRPELFSELNHALKTLRLSVVQADMTSLGGRIICNFILCVTNSMTSKFGENEVKRLKQSLRIVFGRIVSSSSSTTSSNYRTKSKRQRFFCSSSYNTNDCR